MSNPLTYNLLWVHKIFFKNVSECERKIVPLQPKTYKQGEATAAFQKFLERQIQ